MSTYVNLLDVVYPIGSVMLKSDSTSPASTIGGTWTKVKDGTYLCAGGTNLSTGGSNTHSLTAEEIPGAYWHTDTLSRDTLDLTFNAGSYFGIKSAPKITTGNAFSIMPTYIKFSVYYRIA